MLNKSVIFCGKFGSLYRRNSEEKLAYAHQDLLVRSGPEDAVDNNYAGSFPLHTAYYFLFLSCVCGFRSFAPGIRREPYGVAPGFLDIVQCALHQINEV
jgi:hypothetical protein